MLCGQVGGVGPRSFRAPPKIGSRGDRFTHVIANRLSLHWYHSKILNSKTEDELSHSTRVLVHGIVDMFSKLTSLLRRA